MSGSAKDPAQTQLRLSLALPKFSIFQQPTQPPTLGRLFSAESQPDTEKVQIMKALHPNVF